MLDQINVTTLTEIIASYLPEPHAGLLSGISFGTKAAMSTDLTQALIRTGTLHIVALSGMNISIVSSIVSATLLRFVSRRITSLLTIFIIIGFIWFVGTSASVVRAGIMGGLSLLAIVMGRGSWALLSWFLAVAVMLVFNFSWVTDLSFQLSSMATLGIILFGGKKPTTSKNLKLNTGSLKLDIDAGKLKIVNPTSSFQLQDQASSFYRLPSIFWFFISDDLRITLAAQVFTIPIILFKFHRISLISPLANILIGWTIGPLTILGWFTGIAGLVFDPLGLLFAWFAWVPLQFVLWAITISSTLPFASLSF